MQDASETLVKALMIREKYMTQSMQSFPSTTARFLLKLTGLPSSHVSLDVDEDVTATCADDGRIIINLLLCFPLGISIDFIDFLCRCSEPVLSIDWLAGWLCV